MTKIFLALSFFPLKLKKFVTMYCYSKQKSKQITIFTKINKTGYSVRCMVLHIFAQ